jgi:uncharacterized protein (TIGR02186 family)
MRKIWIVLPFVLILCAGPCDADQGAGLDTACGLGNLAVSDQNIRVTWHYQGERVRVSGVVAPGCDVVVKLTSPREAAVFSLVGKAGPIWLSRGRIYFDNVPRMYKEKGSRPLEQILGASDQIRYHLGRRGLRASIKIRDSVVHPRLYINELIAVREASRLFSLEETGVRRQGSRFSTSFFWPPGAPSGRYEIEALAINDQRVVAVRTAFIEIHKVGVENFIGDLARNNGVLYGLFAVALALAVGYAMSMLFALFRRRAAKPAPAGRKAPADKDLAA